MLFRSQYEKYGATLISELKIGVYSFSLFHYPEEDLYEINIRALNANFLDPASHTDKTFNNISRVKKSEINTIKTTLNNWINIRGHLVFGSHNKRRIEVYKRLLSKLITGVHYEKWPRPVEGGGEYWCAITYDNNILNR